MNFMRGLAMGTADLDAADARKTAMTDMVGEQKVDTCYAFDTGQWETGIKRDGDWTIVEKYVDEAAARVGHPKWVADLTAKPDMDLGEVGINEWLDD